ncbi:MAG: hypothetical protein NT069_31275 [Planctomycetota bacterium]|nr:hypothetical protein [Planctomycetota bacterium]
MPLIQSAVEKGQGAGDETLLEHLGDVLDRLGRSAEAIDAWKKAVEMGKKSPYPDTAQVERTEQKVKAREMDGGKIPPVDPEAP